MSVYQALGILITAGIIIIIIITQSMAKELVMEVTGLVVPVAEFGPGCLSPRSPFNHS